MKIPNGLMAHEGELLFSYIQRLAKTNGLPMDLFIESYVWPNQNIGNKKLLFSAVQRITDFYSCASEFIDDPFQFYLEHSLYPIVGPLSYHSHQSRLINSLFEQGKRFPDLTLEANSTFTGIRICPQCAEEEIREHGHFWYHREHQVPGVRVCSKHNCGLLYCRPSEKRRYTIGIKDFFPMESGAITDFDIKYARFCEDFLGSNFSTNWDIIRKGLFDRILKVYYPNEVMKDRYQRVADAISDGAAMYLGKNPVSSVRQVVYGKGTIQAKLTLLCVLFKGDISAAAEIMKEDAEMRETFLDHLHQYTIIGSYNETVVTLQHDACGTVFHVTPHAFLTGWTCPSCNSKSDPAMFEEVCRRLEAGDYLPREPFTALTDPITMRHKSCGQVFVTTPYTFLYQDIRCVCEHRVTKKKAEERLDKAGFKLIKYSGYELPAILRGIDCHHKFEVDSLYTFLRHPVCPICYPDRQLRNPKEGTAEEHFRKRIKELTGDEYTLIGEYKTARTEVELLHNEHAGGCGKVFSMTPDQFTRGSRCPYCSPRIMRNAYPDIVRDVTLGVYTAVSASTRNRTYDVTDTRTGETITLTGAMILQELRRPTMSPILRLEEKNPDAILNYLSSTDRLRMIIRERFRHGGLIYLDQIDYVKEGLTEAQYNDGIRGLCYSGEISKVYYRVYQYTSDNLTIEDIDRELFLVRDGKRIGYLIGQSYLHHIGLRDAAPDVPEYAVNNRQWNAINTPVVAGRKVKVNGTIFPVDEETWEHAALLHYLSANNNLPPEEMDYLASYISERGWDIGTFEPYLDLIGYKARKRIKQLCDKQKGEQK